MSAGDAISQQQFATTALTTRIAFLLELARRLHQYGTSAPRLEMAVAGAALRLGLLADVWSSPTAVIISFADLGQGEEGVAQTTQVMRLSPGEVNLERLCQADDIADRAIAGELDLREGFRLLRELGRARYASREDRLDRQLRTLRGEHRGAVPAQFVGGSGGGGGDRRDHRLHHPAGRQPAAAGGGQ